MVCIERMEQLKLKEKLISQKKAEDEMYADLWEKDRLQKVSFHVGFCSFFCLHVEFVFNSIFVM